jgi:Fe-S cluster biogenesis protein NfuA
VNVSENPTPEKSVEERAREAIERVRPYIQSDGGDIEFVDMKDGVVSVRLHGACTGCPHAALTLKAGVERHLMEHIPEVREVVNVGM